MHGRRQAVAATTDDRLPLPQQRRSPLSWMALASSAVILAASPAAHALEVAAEFEAKCAGCHAGGGNIIRWVGVGWEQRC